MKIASIFHATAAVAIAITLLLTSSIASAANPAPYTNEAYKRLENASAAIRSTFNPQLSKKERLREGVTLMRLIFEKAGYDYDDTIVKVVNDMRTNPAVLPKNPDSVFTMIYVGLHFILSECDYEKVDCLPYFNTNSRDSVKWLKENTEFNL